MGRKADPGRRGGRQTEQDEDKAARLEKREERGRPGNASSETDGIGQGQECEKVR